MNIYYLIAAFSVFLSSCAQILLKKSALKKHDGFIKEYLNPWVISGYAITLLCMLLTILAYRGMPYKFGAVMESLTYVFILILSRLFLSERISRRQTAGIFVIMAGVIIFSLGS